MSSHRSPFVRSLLLVIVCVAAIAGGSGLDPRFAGALAVRESRPALAFTEPAVSLETTDKAVPVDGAFSYDAVVSLSRPAPFLQVRLRVRRPSGRLLFQKTYVRSDVPSGTHVFTFARSIDDLDLDPDVYPVELTVKSEDNPPDAWAVREEMRVYDPNRDPLRLAVVVRVSSPPLIDPEGRFVVDPAVETRARDQVDDLCSAVVAKPWLKASLSIAPELVEEWKRITTGYTYASPAGLEQIGADSSTSQAYARTLGRLDSALATRRLELMNVPYADPDVAGLASIGRIRDLGVHYERGLSTYFAATEQTPSAGSFTARGCLTESAAREAAAHGVRYAVVASNYVRSSDGTMPGGAYASTELPVVALVPDAGLSAAFGSTEDSSAVGLVFARFIANENATSTTLPVLAEVGPGRRTTIGSLVRKLEQVADVAWAEFVTARDAASKPTDTELTLAQRASVHKRTPAGWWSAIAASRRYAEALSSALPDNDRDGEIAVVDSLIAQSAAWAGPDGRWALAERGRSFSSAALRRSQDILDEVTVSASDVTLSGSSGEVPFSITNGSGRDLEVVLRLSSDTLAAGTPRLRRLTLRPAENYVTVPVDLRSSVGSALRLDVVAGTLVIATQAVDVRASYLDRLAIVAAIALGLGLMLFYIRRRVRRADEAAGGEQGV